VQEDSLLEKTSQDKNQNKRREKLKLSQMRFHSLQDVIYFTNKEIILI